MAYLSRFFLYIWCIFIECGIIIFKEFSEALEGLTNDIQKERQSKRKENAE